MKKVALATALVLSSAFALSAYAQEKSRPEVKSETASAVKGGAIPRGEAAPTPLPAVTKQTPEEAAAARAKRKADAASAAKAGAIPKGEAATAKATEPARTMTKEEAAAARAKRKADAASAAKAGAIQKGETAK